MSFRIDSDLRAALEEEGKNLGVSLNNLVLQIFNRYMSWGRYANKLKFLPASRELLRSTFSTLRKEVAEKIGRDLGETQAHDEILFLFQRISPATVLRYIEIWCSHFDAAEHRYDDRRHYFTIHHDVNLNFSLFTKEYVSSMVQTTLLKTPHFETVSPNSLTFDIER